MFTLKLDLSNKIRNIEISTVFKKSTEFKLILHYVGVAAEQIYKFRKLGIQRRQLTSCLPVREELR